MYYNSNKPTLSNRVRDVAQIHLGLWHHNQLHSHDHQTVGPTLNMLKLSKIYQQCLAHDGILCINQHS